MKAKEENIANTQLAKDILRLRGEGLTYNQIKEQLGCSKSTISYYCSPKSRENTDKRLKEYKENNAFKVKLIKKINSFKTDRYKYRAGGKLDYCKD